MTMHHKQSPRALNFDHKSTLGRRRNQRMQKAVLDLLESRQMMSASVSLADGVLSIQGDSINGSALTATLMHAGTEISASAGSGHSILVAAASVKQINIIGGSGSDTIFVDRNITAPTSITGGDGNDQIRGGGGADTIIDGNGNDWISGRGTTNYIRAGSGNDTVLGSAGADTIITADGNDSVDGASGNDSITVGNGNDTVTADSGDDTVVAGNGKDSINGGLGNDQLTLGTGVSTIIAGSGTNSIQAASTLDTIVHSSGTNSFVLSNTVSAVTIPTPTAATPTVSTPIAAAPQPMITPVAAPTSSTSVATSSSSWVTHKASTGSGTAPTAVVQVLAPASTAGIAIDVRALSSTLGVGSPIDADYQWNFGDSAGKYNTLAGFNASHVYTIAGTYNITLTVTNNLRQTSTVTTSVVISPDSRRMIYVDSVHGNDSSTGLTPGSAVKTAARASALVGNNTEVRFARGETFDLAQAFKLNYTDVLVGSYGSGSQPVINYTRPGSGSVIFTTNSSSAKGVTIEDLTLTTLNGAYPTIANQPMAVMAGGIDTSVLRCTFDYVQYDINASAAPMGLTAIDNSSPINGGLQGYFLWDQGTDSTVIGNSVNGSVREHDMRTTGASEILVYDNKFSNYDGKGAIEIHTGSYAWVDSNTVNSGDIRVGPLGLWNEPLSDATNDCVIQNNRVNNVDIKVYPGAHSISIRNNIISTNSSDMIDVHGQDGLGRQSGDIRILNNTGISTGSTGKFLRMESHTNGILLENNLLVQPHLAVGGYAAAPVYVSEANLSSFTHINGNVWQEPAKFYPTANGGVNYVGNSYLTAGAWNNESQVGTDYFYNVYIDPATDAPAVGTPAVGAPAIGSTVATAASPVAGVLRDIYGTARPASGAWTAGAVEV